MPIVNTGHINEQLIQLDKSVQALGAISCLLNLCPANAPVRANALGHLLHVVHKDISTCTKEIDASVEQLSQQG